MHLENVMATKLRLFSNKQIYESLLTNLCMSE